MIEPGDIVRKANVPDILFRVYKIQGDLGHFYRVTKSGRKDRRQMGFTAGLTGYELVRKCEFPLHTNCQKCGGESVVLVNGRCPTCKPFRACTVQGCLGDFESRPTPNWMNRFICNKCGIAVSR